MAAIVEGQTFEVAHHLSSDHQSWLMHPYAWPLALTYLLISM